MGQDKGIRLSEEHGVNPSVQKCFWCGKDMGVVLFGKTPKKRFEKMFGGACDVEGADDDACAPHTVVVGLEPCTDCEVWTNGSRAGVFVVEAVPLNDKDVTYTGAFVCVKEEMVHLFACDSTDGVLQTRVAHMEPEPFQRLFGKFLKEGDR